MALIPFFGLLPLVTLLPSQKKKIFALMLGIVVNLETDSELRMTSQVLCVDY